MQTLDHIFMRKLLSLSLLSPHRLAKGDNWSSHLRPRNGSYLLRLEEPALQLGSLGELRKQDQPRALDRDPSGQLTERQVNFHPVLVATFGDLYHSSLICILIHSVQKVVSPNLATWTAVTSVYLPGCHSPKVRTS